MSQDTTDLTLKPNQWKALDCLLAGGSIPTAAAEAEVDRSTVYRWLRGHDEFRAAFNRGRNALADALHARLLELAGDAVGAVHDAVREGDAAVALKLLEGLGLLPKERATIGPETMADVLIARSQAEQEVWLSSLFPHIGT
jgi:hypothetical protein